MGQGVYSLQSNFLFDWYAAKGRHVADYSKYFPPCPVYSENLMQIVPDSPLAQWLYLLQATIHIVVGAKKYLYIQTPYFIPSDSLLQALQSSALGGVDVRLMVSRKSDTFYLDPATHSYYEDLLRAGIRIYEYQDKFIHAKTMVSDGYISVIGSANMDLRSFESNYEINCYMYDPNIAEQNKRIFFEDIKSCREVTLRNWMKRSRWTRFVESVMRLFAPLL